MEAEYAPRVASGGVRFVGCPVDDTNCHVVRHLDEPAATARNYKGGRSVTGLATKVSLAEGGLLPDSDTDSAGIWL